jgi:hypothetical protein
MAAIPQAAGAVGMPALPHCTAQRQAVLPQLPPPARPARTLWTSSW